MDPVGWIILVCILCAMCALFYLSATGRTRESIIAFLTAIWCIPPLLFFTEADWHPGQGLTVMMIVACLALSAMMWWLWRLEKHEQRHGGGRPPRKGISD